MHCFRAQTLSESSDFAIKDVLLPFIFVVIVKTYGFIFVAGLTCWGLVVVLLIRVSKNFSQFLVRHVSQLSQIQEVKVHLQRRYTTQWFYEAERKNR